MGRENNKGNNLPFYAFLRLQHRCPLILHSNTLHLAKKTNLNQTKSSFFLGHTKWLSGKLSVVLGDHWHTGGLSLHTHTPPQHTHTHTQAAPMVGGCVEDIPYSLEAPWRMSNRMRSSCKVFAHAHPLTYSLIHPTPLPT